MPVLLHLPSVLSASAGGQAKVPIEASTVREALLALSRAYPELDRYVGLRDGKLPNYVRVFLGDREISLLQGLDTPVTDGDVLRVVPAIAGG